MLFLGQWLLMSAVWAFASLSAEAESRASQNIGVALAHVGLIGWGLGFLFRVLLPDLDAGWQARLTWHTASFLVSLPVCNLLARFAYVVDGAQAWRIASGAAGGYVLVTLFLQWAVST